MGNLTVLLEWKLQERDCCGEGRSKLRLLVGVVREKRMTKAGTRKGFEGLSIVMIQGIFQVQNIDPLLSVVKGTWRIGS